MEEIVRRGDVVPGLEDEVLATLAAARALCQKVAQTSRTPFVQQLHSMVERLERSRALVQGERAARAEALASMRARKDGAYEERDRVVALAARLAVRCGFAVGQRPHEGPDWGPDWKRVVAIELPTGQVSWHVPESRFEDLLGWVPSHPRAWDHHDTPVKYERVARFVASTGAPDAPIAAEDAAPGPATAATTETAAAAPQANVRFIVGRKRGRGPSGEGV